VAPISPIAVPALNVVEMFAVVFAMADRLAPESAPSLAVTCARAKSRVAPVHATEEYVPLPSRAADTAKPPAGTKTEVLTTLFQVDPLKS